MPEDDNLSLSEEYHSEMRKKTRKLFCTCFSVHTEAALEISRFLLSCQQNAYLHFP